MPPHGSRRRVARALVEHVTDRRALALLVPPPTDARREAELIFPRTQIGGSSGAVISVRALLDLEEPTRFHRDLLRGLRIPPDGSLLDISRTWQQEFSVERATTRFYQEYASVRDRMAEALMAHNPDHPVSSPSAKTRPERGPPARWGGCSSCGSFKPSSGWESRAGSAPPSTCWTCGPAAPRRPRASTSAAS